MQQCGPRSLQWSCCVQPHPELLTQLQGPNPSSLPSRPVTDEISLQALRFDSKDGDSANWPSYACQPSKGVLRRYRLRQCSGVPAAWRTNPCHNLGSKLKNTDCCPALGAQSFAATTDDFQTQHGAQIDKKKVRLQGCKLQSNFCYPPHRDDTSNTWNHSNLKLQPERRHPPSGDASFFEGLAVMFIPVAVQLGVHWYPRGGRCRIALRVRPPSCRKHAKLMLQKQFRRACTSCTQRRLRRSMATQLSGTTSVRTSPTRHLFPLAIFATVKANLQNTTQPPRKPSRYRPVSCCTRRPSWTT